MTAQLHPRGTLRSRFEPVAPSDVFRRLGIGARSCDLGDEGLYLAEELVTADRDWLGASEHPEALAILVLALMIAQRQGSTRLPLDPKGPLRTLVGDVARMAGLELDVPRVMRTIANLTSTPRFNSVIGMAEARLPLVVDLGCVYTERARWLEERVATRLAARLAAPVRETGAIVDELAIGSTLSDEQLSAVRLALAGKLAVVTGGPGTGKTLVAATIVRGFARMGITVALAAQTGKAANRLTEVIATQLRESATPPVAQTLHRLLGYRGGRFAHHAQSPLPIGAVIVDEASMLDLELVDALLDALPAEAPLVLIGDANQLPAIDAGQILTDLTTRPDGARVAVLAKSFRQDTADPDGRAVYEAARAIHAGEIQRLLDAPRRPRTTKPPDEQRHLALDPRAPLEPDDPRAQLATEPPALATDHRAPLDAGAIATAIATHPAAVDDSRAIAADASAIADEPRAVQPRVAAGKPLAVARTPNGLLFRGVEWVDTAAFARPIDATLAVAEALWHCFDGPRALRSGERVFRFTDGAVDPAQRDELEALWKLLSRARILGVTRGLPTGTIALNAHLHQLALDRLSVTGRPDFVPGEPVMVTANDYQRGLFNGDQGIIVRADEGLGRHHYRAVFRTGGELRPFAIEALRDRLELAWALTIHKSQGSELDAVAILLPHDDLPLVTRELIYTGVTRARTGVVIAGSRSVLVNGGKRRALRESGLGERLTKLLR